MTVLSWPGFLDGVILNGNDFYLWRHSQHGCYHLMSKSKRRSIIWRHNRNGRFNLDLYRKCLQCSGDTGKTVVVIWRHNLDGRINQDSHPKHPIFSGATPK
ncbi:unnamed protein product [Allacma fusca]|uniref:Uncharacterized protein n=1 Tax=Allacma fusca TaxID=39272 RepID=A0A8J2LDV0_9HEXA|nr:unnamed protein product [Allacma fusca]